MRYGVIFLRLPLPRARHAEVVVEEEAKEGLLAGPGEHLGEVGAGGGGGLLGDGEGGEGAARPEQVVVRRPRPEILRHQLLARLEAGEVLVQRGHAPGLRHALVGGHLHTRIL